MKDCPASRGSRLDLQPAELEQRRANFPSNPRGARGTTEQDRVRNIGIARRALPRPGSAEPGRSTWNMAPESAGVRPPLNTRAHGAGRANSSDDPGAGPWDRGPSEQTPGPGDHPRAGLASDGSGLRFYPSTSQPVERAALARRVADGMRALVTPRLILRSCPCTARREKKYCRRATSESVFHVEHRAAVGRSPVLWAAWRTLPVHCFCRHGSRREQLGSGTTPVVAARLPMGRRRALWAGVSSAERRRWMARRPRQRLLRKDLAPGPLTLSGRGPIVPYKEQ